MCEDCYRAYYHGKGSHVKAYKHCILAKTVNPAASRNICRCSTVPHFDASGRSRSLFPVGKEEKHLDVGGTGSIQCGLLKLPELVALAKYDGMQTMLGKRSKPGKAKQLKMEKKKDVKIEQERDATKVTESRRFQLKKITSFSLVDAKQRTATSSATTVFEEAEADRDIPLFFRKYTEKYPFGNVHMALRVGPLLIENGVAQSVPKKPRSDVFANGH